MPTSLRTKLVGMGRISSENSNRESKTISFAKKDHYEEFFNSATPGLRPADISIDERHEDGVDQSFIPELKNEGQFIRTHSPIKEYDLKNLEPPKVPNYRVYSISSHKKENDMSIKIMSKTNKPSMTTSQSQAACSKGKLQCSLCTPTVRRDDSVAEKNLEVNEIKPADDLIEKYHRSN